MSCGWFFFIVLLSRVSTVLVMSDTEEYTKLICKIGGNKSYLTTICNGLDQYLDPEQLEGDVLEEAQFQRDKIEERLNILKALFDELLGNPSLTGDDITKFDSYMKGVESKLVKLN